MNRTPEVTVFTCIARRSAEKLIMTYLRIAHLCVLLNPPDNRSRLNKRVSFRQQLDGVLVRS